MAWIYPGGLTVTDFADGSTAVGYESASFIYGSRITIPSSGNVAQFGVMTQTTTGGPYGIKFGLYDTSGNLIVQSTGTSQSSGPGLAWMDSATFSQAVSAGDYFLMVSAENRVVLWGYDTSGNGSFATEAYSTAMASTETISAEAEAATLFGVRLDFTASGASFVPRSLLLGVG